MDEALLIGSPATGTLRVLFSGPGLGFGFRFYALLSQPSHPYRMHGVKLAS